jgi:acetylornithine deacetylase
MVQHKHPPLDKTIQILSDLVAFDGLGGESNLPILGYIKRYLDEQDVPYTLIPNAEGNKASLHARIGPAADGGLVLSGHMDVVPVKGQDWHTDPFVLTEKEGLLYARGSCDMKGFLACCLAMVPFFKEKDLQTPIYLAFSYDEEVGCLAGEELAHAIMTSYVEKPKYAIIGEPSMMQPIVGHKGIIIYKTTVHGSAGHSSRIKQEVSAIHTAAKLILWLEEKMMSLTETDDRFVPNHTSIHVGMVNGGIAPNVIADKCTFFWDVRQIPETNLEALLNEYFDYAKKLEAELRTKFAGTAIVHEMDHPNVTPLDTAADAPIIALLSQINERQDLGTVAYAAEAGQFSKAGFSTIICGPGDIAQAHRANEFVSVEQLNKCVVMLDKLGELFEKQ